MRIRQGEPIPKMYEAMDLKWYYRWYGTRFYFLNPPNRMPWFARSSGCKTPYCWQSKRVKAGQVRAWLESLVE